MRTPIALSALALSLAACVTEPECPRAESLSYWNTTATACAGCDTFALELSQVEGEWPFRLTGKVIRLDYWRADLVTMYDAKIEIFRAGDCHFTAADKRCFYPEASK